MTARWRPAALETAAAVTALLALAWFAGGQAQLGRIDPALVLPWLLPVLAALALFRHRMKKLRVPAFAGDHGFFLVAGLLLLAQAILAFALSGQMSWAQLALVGVGAGLAEWLAFLLPRWRAGRMVRGAAALLLVGAWFAGSHLLLATLYRPAAAHGPPATMLTGLPLRWSEGSDLSAMLAAGLNEDPVLVRIEAAGPVRLVDSLIDSPPPPGGALLLAHPRALAPRELVAIDAFVRGGGRAVILADALTGWPMRHPIGDPRNPPVTSLLTPLLDHWGVTLGAAPAADRRIVPVDIDGARLRLFTAGRFVSLPTTCRVYADRHVARCRIGRGEIWLVGDADLLFASLWQPAPRWAAHLRQADTMEWIAARLWSDAPVAMLKPLWIRTAAK